MRHDTPMAKLPKLDKELYEAELLRLQAELVEMQEWLRTEGKRLVVVVGSRKAFEMAVRNDDDGQRHSGLKERLRDLVRGDGVHPESHVPRADTPARGAGNETQEND